MVRFTFVVGGGKLVRSRYAEDLPKWMATALRDIGFSEDRSAAETFDSQGIILSRDPTIPGDFNDETTLLFKTGTFKQQHDTGQNLKYLIVYPRVACAAAAAAAPGGASGGKVGAAGPGEEQLDTKSPEYIVSACELETFKEIVASKTSSWRQSKRLLKVLQDSVERFQAIEAKLCSGAPLTPFEQSVYEANSGVDAEKITWLQVRLQATKCV
jgi:hypothetical protein